MLKRLCLTLSFLFSLSSPARAEEQHSPRMLVHLLDYLAKDYPGAIGEDGKVISDSEFNEQKEFAETAYKNSLDIPELNGQDRLKAGIKELHEAIEAKAPPSKITPMARELQQQVIVATKMEVAPQHWPDAEKAKQLFAANCVLCHGQTGAGDGPAGVSLDPKPANFLSHERMDVASPLGTFNTIRLGVTGTGMTPFPQLSDEETWALAFYVVGLRHQKPQEVPASLTFDQTLLNQAATMSDIDLARALNVELNDTTGKLAAVRLHQESAETVNTLALARAYLNDAEKAYGAGDKGQAKDKALRSYLEGVEPVEPRLKAQDAQMVTRVETSMLAVRGAIEQNKTAAELHEAVVKAQADLDAADNALKAQGIDRRVAFAAASGILLREGFEAALLILSLLSVIRALGARRAALWVHGGWILALALGFLCWFLVGVVFDVSGAQRELMEGTTSLFAVLVLITVGFWLHKHSEINRWTRFLKEKVQDAIDGKNLFGLATISFLAVFREALETVLFLRVLWFEADSAAKSAMVSGTVITIAVIILASWAAVKYSAKLPVNKLFQISAYIMAVLAFILTGKGVHSLQESGVVGVHELLSGLRWDLAGVFPTIETLGSQLLIMMIIAILWIQGRKPSPAKAETAS